MGKAKKVRKIVAIVCALACFITSFGVNGKKVSAETAVNTEKTDSRSIAYVKAMGSGWNLGNTFEGFNADNPVLGGGETAWGNPKVTKELLKAVKANGFQSIRMPITIQSRYTEKDGKYVIDAGWLARYKEVVDMAVNEGFYVLVDLHGDAWSWLNAWDGNENSMEYQKYTQIWTQLATYLKDEGDKVSFETINEPGFSDSDNCTAQQKLDKINMAAYQCIRKSGGNNATRMIVMPTMNTNFQQEKSKELYDFIAKLNDENIIATVHYYSIWMFSANLGLTGFDEETNEGKGDTPRAEIDTMFDVVKNTFIDKGIGVLIGEYGLLGYDAGMEVNQQGEELKYYEYINKKARDYNTCLMFWDNGSGINRNDTKAYSWKKENVGKMIEACIKGERSSYATGLDTIYFNDKNIKEVKIPLTLNDNTFVNIKGLKKGTDYTYDQKTATVTIKKKYIAKAYKKLASDKEGTIADLVFQFSSGADWHQYLVKCKTPEFGNVVGTADSLVIPVDFNGSKVRRMYALENDKKVGPHSSWWKYIEFSYSYLPNYTDSTITIKDKFFADESVVDGDITFVFEFYDGQIAKYTVTKTGKEVATKAYTVKGIQYIITKSVDGNNNGTVTVVGVDDKDVSSITIEKTVKIEGKTYRVTAIGDNVFKDCMKLKKIKIKTNELTSVGSQAISGIDSIAVID
ncbi:cellulase family glycosylhydrolase [Anaerosporobacter sp.]